MFFLPPLQTCPHPQDGPASITRCSFSGNYGYSDSDATMVQGGGVGQYASDPSLPGNLTIRDSDFSLNLVRE